MGKSGAAAFALAVVVVAGLWQYQGSLELQTHASRVFSQTAGSSHLTGGSADTIDELHRLAGMASSPRVADALRAEADLHELRVMLKSTPDGAARSAIQARITAAEIHAERWGAAAGPETAAAALAAAAAPAAAAAAPQAPAPPRDEEKAPTEAKPKPKPKPKESAATKEPAAKDKAPPKKTDPPAAAAAAAAAPGRQFAAPAAAAAPAAPAAKPPAAPMSDVYAKSRAAVDRIEKSLLAKFGPPAPASPEKEAPASPKKEDKKKEPPPLPPKKEKKQPPPVKLPPEAANWFRPEYAMSQAALHPVAKCPYSLKVYVYEFAAALPFYERARAERTTGGDHYCGDTCILGQFSLELVLDDFFRHSCVRTADPSEADYFYVPFLNDVEYRHLGRPDEATVYGKAILSALDGEYAPWEETYNITSEHWKKKKGADHIIVMGAPVTGIDHPKGRRGWFHSMLQLKAPIFISVELFQSFVDEYKECATKNIVVPYPNTGAGWFNGEWAKRAKDDVSTKGSKASKRRGPLKNDTYVFAQIGMHGCVGVRQPLLDELKADDRCVTEGGFGGNDDVKLYLHRATFCPCPVGDSPSAKRMYDVVLAGCIPVVVSDEFIYAYSGVMGGPVVPTDFAVVISQTAAKEQGILKTLDALDEKAIGKLKDGGKRIRNTFGFYANGNYKKDPLVEGAVPNGGAIDELVRALDAPDRKSGETWKRCKKNIDSGPKKRPYVGGTVC